MPHGSLGDTGMDTGDGQVGAEGGAEGMDVDDSATHVILCNPGGLAISIKDANTGRVFEQQSLVSLLAAMFHVVFAIDIDRGDPWALLTSQPDVQKQALCSFVMLQNQI